MVALPNASPTTSPTGASSTEAEEPLETESPLPGIKRGIAIGVACSVSIILIAILAFFAIRRRNRALARGAKQKNLQIEDTGAEFGSQEKTWWTNTPPSPPPPAILPTPSPPPPVEADAHTIYELDAGHMPELHGDTCPQEVEGSGESHSASQEADEQYAQKLKQWREWEIASEADLSPTVRPTHWDLPLLTISPPETSRGDVSPLLRSSWGPTSNGASPISPPQNAHFQSRRLS